ncbi:DUF4192 domain-containing protein [Nonomuraea sp. NPDC049649]|uniref:DUF4192 domain-containing protein n=1 Tax=Nonomuraea sp. NPDC049649 TaxID=3155776 RepID=UPI00342895DD
MTIDSEQTIKVNSPADLLSVVPYLLGFHPSLSMVVTIIDAEKATVGGVLRFDLPQDSADAPELANHLTSVLIRNKVSWVVLVGYGPGDRVSPVVDAATEALNRAGIRIKDALRSDQGRYWSYTCTDTQCCPPEGAPLDISSGVPAATAVLAGFVALPDRETLVATLEPVDGPDRERVQAATQVACERTRTLIETGHDWYREGIDQISAALDRVQAGGNLDADEVATLGVRLTAILVRDAAMTFLGDHDDETHLRLWTDVARRVPSEFAAAPAALLGFVALRTGDGALARIAAERALSVDPDYRLASLICAALHHGLPPEAIAGMSSMEMKEAIDASAERCPQGTRPILPEGW